MNRDELSAKVAEKMDTSASSAREMIGVVMDCIGDAMKDGEEVRLVGFGTFYPHPQAARKGRNPKTGEAVQIPARIAPKFRAGSALKEKVNG